MGGAGHEEPQDVSGGLHLKNAGKSLLVVRQMAIQFIDSFGNFLWILNGKTLCWQTNFHSGVFIHLFCFVWTGSHYAAQAVTEHTILLPLPLKSLDYMCALLCLAYAHIAPENFLSVSLRQEV